jgi:hypothetical protein
MIKNASLSYFISINAYIPTPSLPYDMETVKPNLYKLNVTVKKYRGGYIHAMWGLDIPNENKRLFKTKVVFRVFHSGLDLTDVQKGILSPFVFDGIREDLRYDRFYEEDCYQLEYDSATNSSLKVFTREHEVDFSYPTKEDIERKRKAYETDLKDYIDKRLDIFIRLEKERFS